MKIAWLVLLGLALVVVLLVPSVLNAASWTYDMVFGSDGKLAFYLKPTAR